MMGESGACEEARVAPLIELSIRTRCRGRSEVAMSAPVVRIADGEPGFVMTTSAEARVGAKKSVRIPCGWLVGNPQLEMPRTRALSRTRNNRLRSGVRIAFI